MRQKRSPPFLFSFSLFVWIFCCFAIGAPFWLLFLARYIISVLGRRICPLFDLAAPASVGLPNYLMYPVVVIALCLTHKK